MYTINTSNVTIMVKDMDKSVDFYVKGLGLSLQQRWGNFYAIVTAPGVSIGLHPAKDANTSSTQIAIGFGIDDLKEAEKRLDELGVQHQRAEEEAGIFANFQDPDGVYLYFMQSKIGKW
jgi:catechol 2,3-dioxygenase-like lactoylglutathione lyase family enzyme